MAGALDEDTAQTLASGRETVGSLLSSAQQNLKKVFLVFLVGWLGTFWALRAFIWDRLKDDLVFNRLDDRIAEGTSIVATDPFQVILLQIKIGVIAGILFALPVLVYLSRDALKERGYWPDGRVPRWKKVSFAVAIFGLFLGGLSYAYFFFFPIMFDFLATNAVNAEFKATWSIVMWTEFIVFLSLSFGLAAQLPLLMSASARSGIIPYETFREKWRYAVVAIFVFGAMFSPPDPFTQIMWGVPLVALYFISLGITKFAVLSKRAGAAVPMKTVARQHWNILAGTAALTAGGVYAFFYEGGVEAINDVLAFAGSQYRFVPGERVSLLGLPSTTTVAIIGVVATLIVLSSVAFYLRIKALEKRMREQQAQAKAAEPSIPAPEAEDAPPGERAEIDLAAMSVKAVEAAPTEAFVGLTEKQSVQYARHAMDNDEPAKAKAILERFDEAQAYEAEATEEAEEEDEGGNLVTSTAAGIVDPFTEDETTEDDIGGYYYDIRFILDSLTSKAIWIVATFMVVLAGSFVLMYQGGLGEVTAYFLQNMPASDIEEVDIVVLHPVEALIFMIKFSTLLAGIAVLPILLYFAWPAIEQRFDTSGDRSILLVWAGTMLVALFAGTLLGFVYIAPTVISLLAADALSSNMVIAYRISNFGWLVIYLTVGLGALAMIPATMLLFNHGNIISHRRMRKSWRGVVLAFFAVAAFFSSSGIFTMFIVGIPMSLAYGLGLGLVWVYERLRTRSPDLTPETAD